VNTTHGFARVAAATPLVRVADTAFNAAQAIALLIRRIAALSEPAE